MWGSASSRISSASPILPGLGHVSRQREPGPPVLRATRDHSLAELPEAPGHLESGVGMLEPFEGQIGTVWNRFDQPLPGFDRPLNVALRVERVAEIQIRRCGAGIDLDRLGVGTDRLGWLTSLREGASDLVTEEAQDLLIVRVGAGVNPGDLLAHTECVRPLVLVLVELLQVDERVPVFRVEPDHLLERLERAVHEPAVPEIEPEAEQDIGVFDLGEI